MRDAGGPITLGQNVTGEGGKKPYRLLAARVYRLTRKGQEKDSKIPMRRSMFGFWITRSGLRGYDMKVKDEINRLAREYGKLDEPLRCVVI